MSGEYKCVKVVGNSGTYPSVEAWQAAEGMAGVGVPRYENPILNERAKTHGLYVQTAGIAQGMKGQMRVLGWSGLTAEVRESLDMIAVKMARIVSSGRADEQHIEDIIGYAELMRNER